MNRGSVPRDLEPASFRGSLLPYWKFRFFRVPKYEPTSSSMGLSYLEPGSRLRKQCINITFSVSWKCCSYAIILLHTIFLTYDDPGIDTDDVYGKFLQIVDIFVTLYFTAELIIHVIAVGIFSSKYAYFTSINNIFNFVAVIGGFVAWKTGTNYLNILRSFRLLELLIHPATDRIQLALYNSRAILLYMALLFLLIIWVFGLMGLFMFGEDQIRTCYDDSTGQDTGIYCSISDDNYACSTGYTCEEASTERFDNILSSMMASFRIASMDQWHTLVSHIELARSTYFDLYFLALAMIGTLVCYALPIAMFACVMDMTEHDLLTLWGRPLPSFDINKLHSSTSEISDEDDGKAERGRGNPIELGESWVQLVAWDPAVVTGKVHQQFASSSTNADDEKKTNLDDGTRNEQINDQKQVDNTTSQDIPPPPPPYPPPPRPPSIPAPGDNREAEENKESERDEKVESPGVILDRTVWCKPYENETDDGDDVLMTEADKRWIRIKAEALANDQEVWLETTVGLQKQIRQMEHDIIQHETHRKKKRKRLRANRSRITMQSEFDGVVERRHSDLEIDNQKPQDDDDDDDDNGDGEADSKYSRHDSKHRTDDDPDRIYDEISDLSAEDEEEIELSEQKPEWEPKVTIHRWYQTNNGNNNNNNNVCRAITFPTWFAQHDNNWRSLSELRDQEYVEKMGQDDNDAFIESTLWMNTKSDDDDDVTGLYKGSARRVRWYQKVYDQTGFYCLIVFANTLVLACNSLDISTEGKDSILAFAIIFHVIFFIHICLGLINMSITSFLTSKSCMLDTILWLIFIIGAGIDSDLMQGLSILRCYRIVVWICRRSGVGGTLFYFALSKTISDFIPFLIVMFYSCFICSIWGMRWFGGDIINATSSSDFSFSSRSESLLTCFLIIGGWKTQVLHTLNYWGSSEVAAIFFVNVIYIGFWYFGAAFFWGVVIRNFQTAWNMLESKRFARFVPKLSDISTKSSSRRTQTKEKNSINNNRVSERSNHRSGQSSKRSRTDYGYTDVNASTTGISLRGEEDDEEFSINLDEMGSEEFIRSLEAEHLSKKRAQVPPPPPPPPGPPPGPQSSSSSSIDIKSLKIQEQARFRLAKMQQQSSTSSSSSSLLSKSSQSTSHTSARKADQAQAIARSRKLVTTGSQCFLHFQLRDCEWRQKAHIRILENPSRLVFTCDTWRPPPIGPNTTVLQTYQVSELKSQAPIYAYPNPSDHPKETDGILLPPGTQLEGLFKTKLKHQWLEHQLGWTRLDETDGVPHLKPITPAVKYLISWHGQVRVRANPDSKAKQLSILPHGQVIECLELKGDWIRHRAGWSLTKVDDDVLIEKIPLIQWQAVMDVPIHVAPSTTSRAIGTLRKGQHFSGLQNKLDRNGVFWLRHPAGWSPQYVESKIFLKLYKGGILLSQITSLLVGKVASIFHTVVASDTKEDCCLSILASTTRLDVEFLKGKTNSGWVNALSLLVSEYHGFASPEDALQVVLSPKARINIGTSKKIKKRARRLSESELKDTLQDEEEENQRKGGEMHSLVNQLSKGTNCVLHYCFEASGGHLIRGTTEIKILFCHHPRGLHFYPIASESKLETKYLNVCDFPIAIRDSNKDSARQIGSIPGQEAVSCLAKKGKWVQHQFGWTKMIHGADFHLVPIQTVQGDGRLPFPNIRDMMIGKQSQAFANIVDDDQVIAESCCSVVTSSQQLDLQFETKQQCSDFVRAVAYLSGKQVEFQSDKNDDEKTNHTRRDSFMLKVLNAAQDQTGADAYGTVNAYDYYSESESRMTSFAEPVPQQYILDSSDDDDDYLDDGDDDDDEVNYQPIRVASPLRNTDFMKGDASSSSDDGDSSSGDSSSSSSESSDDEEHNQILKKLSKSSKNKAGHGKHKKKSKNKILYQEGPNKTFDTWICNRKVAILDRPGTSKEGFARGQILGALTAGTRVLVVESKGDWLRHAQGWSLSRTVIEDDDEDDDEDEDGDEDKKKKKNSRRAEAIDFMSPAAGPKDVGVAVDQYGNLLDDNLMAVTGQQASASSSKSAKHEPQLERALISAEERKKREERDRLTAEKWKKQKELLEKKKQAREEERERRAQLYKEERVREKEELKKAFEFEMEKQRAEMKLQMLKFERMFAEEQVARQKAAEEAQLAREKEEEATKQAQTAQIAAEQAAKTAQDAAAALEEAKAKMQQVQQEAIDRANDAIADAQEQIKWAIRYQINKTPFSAKDEAGGIAGYDSSSRGHPASPLHEFGQDIKSRRNQDDDYYSDQDIDIPTRPDTLFEALTRNLGYSQHLELTPPLISEESSEVEEPEDVFYYDVTPRDDLVEQADGELISIYDYDFESYHSKNENIAKDNETFDGVVPLPRMELPPLTLRWRSDKEHGVHKVIATVNKSKKKEVDGDNDNGNDAEGFLYLQLTDEKLEHSRACTEVHGYSLFGWKLEASLRCQEIEAALQYDRVSKFPSMLQSHLPKLTNTVSSSLDLQTIVDQSAEKGIRDDSGRDLDLEDYSDNDDVDDDNDHDDQTDLKDLVNWRIYNALLVLVTMGSMFAVADFQDDDNTGSEQTFVETIEILCSILFTVDAIIKIKYAGLWNSRNPKVYTAYFKSFFNWVDFIVIIGGIVNALFIFIDRDHSSLQPLLALRAIRLISSFRGPTRLAATMGQTLIASRWVLASLVFTCIAFVVSALILMSALKGRLRGCFDNDDVAYDYDFATCASNGYNWINDPSIAIEGFDDFPNALFSALVLLTSKFSFGAAIASAMDSTGEDLASVNHNEPNYAWLFALVFIIISLISLAVVMAALVLSFLKTSKKEYFQALGLQRRPHIVLWQSALVQALNTRLSPASKVVGYHCHRGLYSEWFDPVMLSFIVITSFVQSFWTGYDENGSNTTVYYITHLASLVFACEIVVKISALGPQLYFPDIFNVLDLILIGLSAAAMWSSDDEELDEDWGWYGNAFRGLRLFRLLPFFAQRWKGSLGYHKYSWQPLVHFATIFLVTLFVYSLAGLHLYQDIDLNSSTSLNETWNFQTFGRSFVMMFRLATFSSWGEVMSDCRRNCASGCGTSLLFFFSFYLLVGIVYANAFMGFLVWVVREDRQVKSLAQPLHPNFFSTFINEWSNNKEEEEYNKESQQAEGQEDETLKDMHKLSLNWHFMTPDRLVSVIIDTGFLPQQTSESYSPQLQAMMIINHCQLPLYQDGQYVHFWDCLLALLKYKFQSTFPHINFEFSKWEELYRSKINRLYPALSTSSPSRPYSLPVLKFTNTMNMQRREELRKYRQFQAQENDQLLADFREFRPLQPPINAHQ